jgi:hypothetical protein
VAEVLENGRACRDVKAGRGSEVRVDVRAAGAVRVAQWLEGVASERASEDEGEEDAGARLAQCRAVAKRRLAAMADGWRMVKVKTKTKTTTTTTTETAEKTDGRLTLDYNGPSVRRQTLRSAAVEICARSPLAVARS